MARPRKEEAIDIPARAVTETVRLLAHRDVGSITMADVAAAVGCRAPALYNHFRNKDALLRAVHDAGFEKLYAEKLAVAANTGKDAIARLREGGMAYLRFALENPALYQLMFNAPPVAGLPDNPFATDIGLRLLGFLRASIAGCQALGYLPGREPDVVAFTLWSTVHGAASLMIGDRVPAGIGDRTALATATVDAVMDMIGATRPPAPPP
ncbi:TetR/AcrR family transcriptional regulator [Azospirillum soli]|uniref:TetR/AcrR family transcriptional regulator n=1 Tax=Azospirillum soli TaxID=1304799 RepID=UPI001AEA2D94|nr:TetR/AcrR family transcriptional regulator [Azospirillum soli]MBP2311359.1 AcrR family transcriptional regulator [Azospirillum soli]